MIRGIYCTLAMLAMIVLASVIIFAILHRDRRPAIYFAVEQGNTNAIDQYLAAGGSVNDVVISYKYGHRQNSLLSIAARCGNLTAMDFLLKNGADPNKADAQGNSPIMEAVSSGSVGEGPDKQIDILKLLLARGANPNTRNTNELNYTPLMEAAMLDRTQMVETLIDADADVNATNDAGQSALQLTKSESVRTLLAGHSRIPQK